MARAFQFKPGFCNNLSHLRFEQEALWIQKKWTQHSSSSFFSCDVIRFKSTHSVALITFISEAMDHYALLKPTEAAIATRRNGWKCSVFSFELIFVFYTLIYHANHVCFFFGQPLKLWWPIVQHRNTERKVSNSMYVPRQHWALKGSYVWSFLKGHNQKRSNQYSHLS